MPSSPLPQNKPLQESDLVALVYAAARENRFIEFKSDSLLQTDGGKRKFLQSVAAFANSSGGDLVLGMIEENGIATKVVPIQNLDPDQTRLQIHDLIRVHLHPSLGGVNVESVPLSTGGFAIVVRIPKSWSGPHILTYNDDLRFYIRDDAGKKRPMEFEEIRDGFLAGETTGARLRNFRLERCAAILNDEVPGPLLQKQRIVLHLLPFEMFVKPRHFEVRALSRATGKLYPIEWEGASRAFDLDGCYTYSSTPEKDVYGYAYAFRSGAIEAVDAQMLSSMEQPENKTIAYSHIEPKLVEAVQAYLSILKSLEMAPPYACFVSLLNVRGHFIQTGRMRPRGNKQITRDHLYLPEYIFDPIPDSVPNAMRPIFDSLWNACGFAGSVNYDEAGNWNPRG